MKWRIVSVGKPSFPWVKSGVAEYTKRLTRFTKVEHTVIKTGSLDEFEKVILPGMILCLDETGTLPTTREAAAVATDWELDAVSNVTVCIGGADGLPESLVKRSDAVWGLGRMTLMHELALLVWMEQLYRIYTLKHDHPYHREG